ncbi:guanine deaminase [Psychrobacter sanguinis]|uniref:guanine deaminase n=1 Tax=Psychrobacter sanguinis TaxID=861445 RepID=UPI00191B168D|nr:guanine deaminase [Psychrobacter sanguinis]
MTLHIYQARLLHYVVVDSKNKPTQCCIQPTSPIMTVNKGDTVLPEYIADGALVVEGKSGQIIDYGHAEDILNQYSHRSIKVHDLADKLIMPGFIDTHVHYPQLDMIAAYGEQLLDWLNNYTFVTEARFDNTEYAKAKSQFFLNQLLANGTTSAMVFATSHLASAEAFFKQSEELNTRMICGNVLMDQNAPRSLCVEAKQGIKDSQNLIDNWHGKGRQLVAITPRFAITSSLNQLKLAGELYSQNKGVYLQTHLAENQLEVAAVRKMYPEYQGYLEVYDKMGLLGRKSILAHGIYLNDSEYQRLQDTGTQIAHCPTSNLFLGSGLFDLPKTLSHTGVSIATDVGAGTSLSLLTTLNEAYKIQQIQGNRLSAHQGFYQITLGNAQSLSLEDKIGNFTIGSEADFVVIDTKATSLLQQRLSQTKTLEEELFVLMMLGDDRVIEQTYIAGICRYQKMQ